MVLMILRLLHVFIVGLREYPTAGISLAHLCLALTVLAKLSTRSTWYLIVCTKRR